MHMQGIETVKAFTGSVLSALCLLHSICFADEWDSLIDVQATYPLIAQTHKPWALVGAEERIATYRKGDFLLKLCLSNGKAIPEGTAYYIKQIDHAFLFGGSLAADWSVPAQPWYSAFKSAFARLFNYATVNFYWGSHEKVPGVWDYQSAPLSNEIFQWAKDQGMVIKGHPLVWHQVIPEWISDSERDVREIDRDIRQHVQRLIKHYPEVDQWDVYNEVPGIIWKDEDLGIRRWQEFMGHKILDNEFVSGPGFVSEALLEIARSLRPDCVYILNHYQHDDPFYHKQIEYCLEKGVAFEAIGVQTHMHSLTQSFSESDLWAMLEFYSHYNKPIYLSEVSILSCGRFEDWRGLDFQEKAWQKAVDAGLPIPTLESTAALEAYQAELTRDFYTLAFSHPKVESITWWTITDLDPWRGMPSGLLDAKGKPKPVFQVLDDLINREWNTQIEGVLQQSSQLAFNGFYGNYSLTLSIDGIDYSGQFRANKASSPSIEVQLNQL